MQTYQFTIVTSHFEKDNIKVSVMASSYIIAFEILVMEYGKRYRLSDMFYQFKN